MGLLRRLCGKQEPEKPETLKDEEEDCSRKERYCRKKEVERQANALEEFWHDWPNQEEEEVSRETITTGFEIPVYELQVNYSDGETEQYRHESFTKPDPRTIEEVERVDIEKCSFLYSESNNDLVKGNVRNETLAAFNRDNINSVKVVNKTERIVELEYELVETEITEKMGSYHRRTEMPHVYDRQRRRYYIPSPCLEFEWQEPETERQLMKKLVDEYSLDYLLDTRTVTEFTAENVEVAANK